MLKSVKDPKGKTTTFEYDALGRRTAKINNAKKEINRYIYNGNVLLHEFKYDLAERPKIIANDVGQLSLDRDEPITNLVTWVFEEGTFVPQAKIVNGETYSIISDYLGTPILSFNEKGKKVWERELDIYGKVKKGDNGFVPFLYQGQYYDEETELAYNRFRYYSPDSGMYCSKDPIGLVGGMPNLYAYVKDSNLFIDPFGLTGITIADLLKDELDLLQDFRDEFKNNPEWQGIDPDKTKIQYVDKDTVDKIRAKPGESGGHHPHGLALDGSEGQKLTITNETRKIKNPKHSKATGMQRKLINRLKKKNICK